MPHGMWDPSFWMRAQTHVPCITRWILNHLTAKGVPRSFSLMDVFHSFLFIDTCLVLTSVIKRSIRIVHMTFLLSVVMLFVFCCHPYYYSFILYVSSDYFLLLHFCLAGSLFNYNVYLIFFLNMVRIFEMTSLYIAWNMESSILFYSTLASGSIFNFY